MMDTPFPSIVPERTFPPTLEFDDSHRRVRERLRNWLAANDPGVPPGDYRERMESLIQWQAALHAAGFIGLSWPARYGGADAGLAAEAVLCQELAASSMPQLINRLALYTWGPAILSRGTNEQKERLLPGMLDASEIWCQGFSEPDAGSDLAAVRTTGRITPDRIVVNGQKVWTSRAELSKWNALLVRTDPESGRHSGLSLLMVDMESPGITVQPLLQALGEPHFSEVFFDDVEVPISNVLGDINDGWSVAMEAMGYERGLFVLERTTGLSRRLNDLRRRLVEETVRPDRLQELGAIQSKLDLLESRVLQTLSHQANGTTRPGATSVDKLFLAEVYQGLFAKAFDLLVEVGELGEDWVHDLIESRSVSIYSGTSEIQRNIIARRLLGLP